MECSTCAHETAILDNGIQTLRMLRPQAPARLVRETQLRCRRKAQELEIQKRKMHGVQLACIISSAWMLLSLPFFWDQFSAVGAVQDLVVHLSFVMMWFMPAMVAVAVALWLRPQLSADDTLHRSHFHALSAVQSRRR